MVLVDDAGVCWTKHAGSSSVVRVPKGGLLDGAAPLVIQRDVRLFFIGGLFVKGHDDAVGTDQELDVAALGADAREKDIEPFVRPHGPEPSTAVGRSEPPEKVAGVALVEIYVEGGKFPRSL